MTERESGTENSRIGHRRDGLSAFHERESLCKIQAIRVDGKAVPAGGNARHGKGNAVFLLKHEPSLRSSRRASARPTLPKPINASLIVCHRILQRR